VTNKKKELNLKDGDGVNVRDVLADGGAAKAGIQKGDRIVKINGTALSSAAEMVGLVATFRPGDKINVTYERDGKNYTVPVVLHNNAGTTEVIKNSILDKLGADLQTLSKKDAADLNVKGGGDCKNRLMRTVYSAKPEWKKGL
jgi:serine protease Do